MGGQEAPETQHVLSYVLQMREKLKSMTQLAQSNLAQAQQRQGQYYDQKAKVRSFETGERVLVMLPSDTSKLLSKWQGPFEVVRKLGPNIYEIANPGKRRTSRVLHVNLLKKWQERLPKVAGVSMIRQVEDEDEVEEQYLPLPSANTVDLNHLSPLQQSQLQKICYIGVCQ